MEELKITKERVLAAAWDCPTAKEVLKKLFPEVFKESPPEWEDVTALCSFAADTQDGPFIVCRGRKIGFLEQGHTLNYSEGAEHKHDVRDGRIWRRREA